MKNNIDLFIKYLDDQMSINECESFENELYKNDTLKKEFEKFKTIYSQRNKGIDIDDRYFTTLLPRAKNRLAKQKKSLNIRYALVLPVIILLAVFLFEPESEIKYSNNYDFDSFWEVITQDDSLANNIVHGSLSFEENYLTDSNFVSEYYTQDLVFDETLFDYLENNISINEINNNLVDSLSEDEFNSLYENLIDKKILGLK